MMKKLLVLFALTVSAFGISSHPALAQWNGLSKVMGKEAFHDSLGNPHPDVTLDIGNIEVNNFIKYNVTPTPSAHTPGQTYWDANAHALSVNMETDVTLNLGFEDLDWVINGTGSDIADGKAVYITGVSGTGTGGHRTIALAKADNYVTADLLGLTTEAIAAGDSGIVCRRGYINGLNTSAYAANDTLWLSPTTAGEFTSTKPTNPYLAVFIGRVVTVSASGRIAIQPRAPIRLEDAINVATTDTKVDEYLKFNGDVWTNGAGATSSASAGISFFMNDSTMVATSIQNDNDVAELLKIPNTVKSTKVDTITVAGNTVMGTSHLYNTTLGRTSIDAGVWELNTYASVSSTSSTLGGRETSLTRQMYRVLDTTGMTMTITGATSEIRTATITGGTPFVAADSSFTSLTKGSYLQTPQGLYRIMTLTSTSVATIAVPTSYTNNESGVAVFVWRKMFGITTPVITAIGSNYTLYAVSSAQEAYTFAEEDKLGEIMFATGTGSNEVYFTHNGSDTYSNFKTPLITLHNNLAGLQGGTGTTELWHLTTAQKDGVAALGTMSAETATDYPLKSAIPDSSAAALARMDSIDVANNALSSDDIAGLSDRLSEALFDVDFGSSGIMKTDGSGTYSILTDGSADWNTAYTDRFKWDGGATGLTAATGRSSLELGSLATLSAIDSALAAANSMAIGDVAGLSDRLSESTDALEDSLANFHTTVWGGTLKVGTEGATLTTDGNKTITVSDTTKFEYISDDSGSAGAMPKGSYLVRHPTTGLFNTRTIGGTTAEVNVTNGNGAVGNTTIGLPDSIKVLDLRADTLYVTDEINMGTTVQFTNPSANVVATDDTLRGEFQTNSTVKVVIPLRNFVFGVEDSTDAFTTQTVVIDTTETSPRNRLQAKVVHCESYTSQIIRFLTSRVFNPANPDSVGLDMLSTATHLDSTAVRIIGKGVFVDASTVWNSDWFTSGTVNTVEHFSFVAPEFVPNSVYEWRIEFRATRDKEIEVSDIFYQ